jgi:hypothetical protein
VSNGIYPNYKGAGAFINGRTSVPILDVIVNDNTFLKEHSGSIRCTIQEKLKDGEFIKELKDVSQTFLDMIEAKDLYQNLILNSPAPTYHGIGYLNDLTRKVYDKFYAYAVRMNYTEFLSKLILADRNGKSALFFVCYLYISQHGTIIPLLENRTRKTFGPKLKPFYDP